MAAQNDKKLAITEPSENDSSLCGYTEPDSLVHKPPTKKKAATMDKSRITVQ